MARERYYLPEAVSDVLILLADGQAIASGGYKPFDDSTADIKRMFSRLQYCNRGYERAITNTLEERSVSQGYTRLVLETGCLLEAAIRMYTKLWFHITENYGQIRCMPQSVYREKPLRQPQPENYTISS